MAKSSKQTAEQAQTAAPRAVPSVTETANTDVPQATGIQRVPLVWRVVFMVFIVCFSLLVLYEISSLIGRLFR